MVKVYADIRAHCETFKDDFFAKDMVVPSALYTHAQYVKITYPVFFDKLKEIQIPSPAPTPEDIAPKTVIVNTVLDTELQFFRSLEASARELIEALRSFEHQTKEDKNNVAHVMRTLDTALMSSEGTTLLRQPLKELKEFNQKYEKKEEEDLCWMRLVGYIPRAFLETPPIKQIIGSINQILSDPAKDDATKMDIVWHHVHFMSEGLEEIKSMIQGAISTVNLLQGYFAAISYDLTALKEAILEVAADDSPLVLILCKHQNILQAWDRLGKSADKYRHLRFQPPEVLL